MRQPRKGNQWYFGMKAHLGADRDSKLVATMVAAVMRKLLCLCVGVLRSGQPWHPTDRPTPKITPPKPE